jgi:two-component system, NarL family, nitrate/nitrite response regulator NarL
MELDSPGVIRILLVDDHVLLRQGLRMLIENHADLQVIGEAANCREALEAAARLQPDLVLLDLDLGSDSGLDIIPQLVSLHEGLRVLILTGVRDAESQRRAIRLGAMGVVPKEQAGDVLIKAIRKVHTGEIWMDHGMTAALIQEFRGRREHAPADSQTARIAALSPREREVVSLVAQGLSARKIADFLHISEKTVRNHLSSIYDKLEVADRLELALYAVKHGLTEPVR